MIQANLTGKGVQGIVPAETISIAKSMFQGGSEENGGVRKWSEKATVGVWVTVVIRAA